MINRIMWLSALTAVLISSNGCSHAPLGKDFGEANTNNITVQTVNPQAEKGEVGLATLDGKKSEETLQRYRSDTGKTTNGKLITNIK